MALSKGLDKGNGKEPRLESGHITGTASLQPPESRETAKRAQAKQTPARPPKAPPLSRRLYDIEAVGTYLGIPAHTVREIIWRGDLSCVRIGRRLYLDIRDVDQFIEQSKTRER